MTVDAHPQPNDSGSPGPERRKVVVIPGDDAAPEAVRATLQVLQGMDLPLQFTVVPDGSVLGQLSREERMGILTTAIDDSAATLYGATSGRTGGVSYLRWGRTTYANVRPIRTHPAITSPLRSGDDIDYVIVRENLEGEYLGFEGPLTELTEHGISLLPFQGKVAIGDPVTSDLASARGSYALRIITEEGTRRVARFAALLARERRQAGHPGRVTCVVKTNIFRRSDGVFRDVSREVIESFGDLEYEERLVDDFARRLVADPYSLDVVLAPNLYGDILSDEGAATVGGLGIAPSGCYGDDYAYFEPSHGTAPDIAGQDVINPIATMYSATMMLDYLGLPADAERLRAALNGAPTRAMTPDVGGEGSCSGFSEYLSGVVAG